LATSTLNVGIPPDMALTNYAIIQFEAISPTTGAVVSGVAISNASVYVETNGNVVNISDVIPQLTPIALDDQGAAA
jgi:hypothetical protein